MHRPVFYGVLRPSGHTNGMLGARTRADLSRSQIMYHSSIRVIIQLQPPMAELIDAS